MLVLRKPTESCKRRNQEKTATVSEKESAVSPRQCPISHATARTKELNSLLLRHPPHSSDSTASDFYLFPNLKKWLAGERFTDDNQVSDAVNATTNVGCQSAITALEHRWKT